MKKGWGSWDCLAWRRLQEDPIAAFQYLKWTYKQVEDWLFTWSDSDGTRGNGFKLNEGKFWLDVRKKFFTLWAVRPWHCCPEGCGAPSLDDAQSQVGRALGQPELVGATSPWQGVGAEWALRLPPTQTILWFCDIAEIILAVSFALLFEGTSRKIAIQNIIALSWMCPVLMATHLNSYSLLPLWKCLKGTLTGQNGELYKQF